MSAALKTSKLITGRQIVHLMCNNLRLHDSAFMVHPLTNIAVIKWTCDSPEQVSLFKADREDVLDTMDPNVDAGEEPCRTYFTNRSRGSKVFDSEMKHYLRTPSGRSYQFLIRAIERYLELDRVEKSREAQVQQQDRERAA